MATRKRTIKPADVRRAALLDAAMDAFAERGVADTTISEITARADVAKGSFYLHFAAKEQVVAGLWERYVAGFLTRAEEVLPPGAVGVDALTTLVRQLIDHAIEHADLHRLVYGSADAKALALCQEANEQVIAVLTGAIERGMAAGTLRQGSAEVFARIVFHGVHVTLHDLMSGGTARDRDAVVATAADIVERVLGPG